MVRNVDETENLRVLSYCARTPCCGHRSRFTPGITGTLMRKCQDCGKRYQVTITKVELRGTQFLRAEWSLIRKEKRGNG